MRPRYTAQARTAPAVALASSPGWGSDFGAESRRTTVGSSANATPPPDPSQSKACRKQCKGNASWDLDDGPCIDARDSPSMRASYYAAVQFAKDFYAYSAWKRLDWAAIEQAGATEASNPRNAPKHAAARDNVGARSSPDSCCFNCISKVIRGDLKAWACSDKERSSGGGGNVGNGGNTGKSGTRCGLPMRARPPGGEIFDDDGPPSSRLPCCGGCPP